MTSESTPVDVDLAILTLQVIADLGLLVTAALDSKIYTHTHTHTHTRTHTHTHCEQVIADLGLLCRTTDD